MKFIILEFMRCVADWSSSILCIHSEVFTDYMEFNVVYINEEIFLLFKEETVASLHYLYRKKKQKLKRKTKDF